MANLIDIDRNQLQRLNMNMRDFERDLLLVAREALKNLGQRIISDAQQTLRRRKNVATSLLINSGAVKTKGEQVMAGFPTLYAYYVEFGRRAGRFPPFRFIYQWVKVKHFAADEQEAKSIAYAIQKSIGKKGTRPHPFLKPAYEKNKPLLVQILKKAARKVMTKDYTR